RLSQADSLTLDQFLDQVRKGNQAYRAQAQSSAGALERSGEGRLLLSPTLFANVQLAEDAKLPTLPFFSYDSITANSYSLGLSQTTTFGLTARVSYNAAYTNYNGGSFAGFRFHDAAPRIELTQSLWANGFGAGTRASVEAAEAQALAQHFGQRFESRLSLAEAESAYWRLATARQLVDVAERTLKRAEKIAEWSSRRARLQLADRADALQSQAALESSRLSFQSARDEAEVAARALNLARGVDSSEVAEELLALEPDQIEKIEAPRRVDARDDVKAASEQARAASAAAESGLQRDQPTLDLFASYAMNGRAAGISDAFSDSWSSGRPTAAVGLRFQAPLAFGTASDARAGWRKEQIAAEELHARRRFEEQTGWKDLSTRLEQSRRRFALAREVERAQGRKVEAERSRLERGRSTTYQVLLFEQDYSQAQLARIRAQSEVLALVAQMKLYGDRS
ncbi:MAG TPA: TolC family protein, partial [Bdellovibrionota bacterium]|nr:TolC family protein [Bdellovibrionota bacterium]